MCNDWFREAAGEQWRDLCERTRGFENVLALIPRLIDVYSDEFRQEAALWSRKHSQDLQAEILCLWLSERIRWMDRQFAGTA